MPQPPMRPGEPCTAFRPSNPWVLSMFEKSSRYYDAIYAFKDYAQEAAKITALIRAEHPLAKTILDVACGTGEHARLLSRAFAVDGLDLEPEFVRAARAKTPAGTFRVADMRSFDLQRRYDVVMCLFSSVGYLKDQEEVVAALRAFARHLAPGGVIVVEPWFTPGSWKVGMPGMVTVDQPDLKICRMHVSGRHGMVSMLQFHYLVATAAGVEQFEERHELTLYSVEEMLACFKAADLHASYDAEGIFGRGLYIARPSA